MYPNEPWRLITPPHAASSGMATRSVVAGDGGRAPLLVVGAPPPIGLSPGAPPPIRSVAAAVEIHRSSLLRGSAGTQRVLADTSRVDPGIVRYSERPELWDGLGDLFDGVWPEYNLHGDVLNCYWHRLYDVFPEWQFMLVDPADQTILAEGHTVPVAWDGTDEGLGPGIDATIAGAFALRAAGGQPTAACALAAEVPPRYQGRGLAPVMLTAMAALTREAGLAHLIAPVRPSHKDRYPTIPIERYARWARDDGSPFDPWVRVHVRTGARIGPVIPKSLRIAGTVADWESWTKMRFPETGDYVFPAGLATVRIDREKDTGEYWEPNIWIIHEVSPLAAGG